MEHSAILSTFIKLPIVIKIFVLSIFEWPLKTGFTVYEYCVSNSYIMVCPPVEALVSGLSPVQVDNHGPPIIQCRPCTLLKLESWSYGI